MRAPVGDDTALVEGHDAVGDVAQHPEIVLHDEHRGVEPVAQLGQQRPERLGVALGHAGRRFVEEQDRRLVREHAREVDDAARPGGELVTEAVGVGAETQPVDGFGVALAKALAKPPVAAELCLPLVEPGGAVVLWLGETADRDPVAEVARLLGGVFEDETDGIVVLRKVLPTPAGFPRRPGMAKKRPLA